MRHFHIFIWALIALSSSSKAADFYAIANGNWNANTTWSNTCGGPAVLPGIFPGAADNVFITCNNVARTVTVNGNFQCANLTLGSADRNAVVQITTAGNSLTINGDLQINTGDFARTYLLNAGPGTISIAGTISYWSAVAGVNRLQVTTGVLNITPSINLSSTTQNIRFNTNGAGTINFNGDVTNSQNAITTRTGCVMNFGGNLTASGVACVFNNTSISNFNGTGRTIDPQIDLTLGVVNFGVSSSTTILNSAGAMNINRDATLLANASLTLNKQVNFNYSVILSSGSNLSLNTDLNVFRNFTNNGGTLSGGTNHVYLRGNNFNINGSSATTFPHLHIGTPSGITRVRYNASTNFSALSLTLEDHSATGTGSLTHGSGVSANITGNATIKQLNTNSANTWNIGDGIAAVGGNIIFNGSSDVTSRICRVQLASGTCTVSGTVNWLSNSATVTEDFLCSTGNLSFGGAVNMPIGSGQIRTNAAGTVTFGGLLTLNAVGVGVTNATLGLANGTTVNFGGGFTNNATALNFLVGVSCVFTASGGITPNAMIRFGNLTINNGVTLALNGNIELLGNWSNNGGTLNPGTNTVSTVSNAGVQTLLGETNFYRLSINGAAQLQLLSNIQVLNQLNMSADININGFTLTLGNGGPSTLNYTNGDMYGGTFRRYWPSGASITSSSGNFYGLFPMGNQTSYRPITIDATAAPTGAGFVSVTRNEAGGTQDVTFNDGGPIIQRIALQSATINSTVSGGTYNLSVAFRDFVNLGNITDLRLATYTSAVIGVAGTHSASTGTVQNPTCARTGITAAGLSNVFVAGTSNSTTTPLSGIYYSIASGNWGTAGTWSLTAGGPSCGCNPTSGDVVISTGHNVVLNVNRNVSSVTVSTGGILSGASNLTTQTNLTIVGTGSLNSTGGTYNINGSLILSGTGTSTKTAGALTVNGNLEIGAGTTLDYNSAGQFNLNGNLVVNGTLQLNASNLRINGNNVTISGTGSVLGTTGGLQMLQANNRIFPAGTNLTVSNIILNNNSATVQNQGIVSVTGNLTGNNSAACIWHNENNSQLSVVGSLFPNLAQLQANYTGNIVTYSGTTAVTIKTPVSNEYRNLVIANTGVRTLPAGLTISESLQVNAGATLSFGSLAYTIVGDFTNNGTISNLANLTLEGDFTNLGLPATFSNQITFSGSSNSSLDGNASFSNLIIDKSGSTVTCSGNQIITGRLTVNDGTLDANGGLTIRSDASGTGAIGPIGASGNIIGNVTVERYLNDGNGWYIFGSPLTNAEYSDWHADFDITSNGADISGATVTSFTSFYTFDETQAGDNTVGFTPVVSILPGEFISNGTGHFAWIQNDTKGSVPRTLNLTGEVNTSAITNVPVSFTNTGNPFPSADGLNLLANPFACPVDLDDVTWPGTLFGGTVTVLDVSTQNFVVPAGNIVSSGEAFYAQLSAGGTAEFPQSAKRPTAADGFNKRSVNEGSILDKTLNLSIIDGAHQDQAHIRFESNASKGIDPAFELRKIDNLQGKTNIATLVDDTKFLINGISYDSALVIPIVVYKNFNQGVTRSYELRLSNVEMHLKNGICLMLEDTATKTLIPINGDTTYQFSMNEGNDKPRLFLHLNPALKPVVQDNVCALGLEGKISVGALSNGTADFIYLNENNDTLRFVQDVSKDTLEQLSAGQYTIVMLQQPLCAKSFISATVTEPDSFLRVDFADDYIASDKIKLVNLSSNHVANIWTMGDGNEYQNQDTVVHTYSEAGIYNLNLTVRDIHGCEKSITKGIVIEKPLVTSINSKPSIQVFPNPTQDVITINGIKDATSLKLISFEGKIVFKQLLSNSPNDINIDLSNVPSGIYHLEVDSTNEVGVRYKVVKL